MSDYAARSAISRMHLRELAVALHYSGLPTDLQMLAAANHEQAQADFLRRRGEMVEAYGLSLSVENERKPSAFSAGIAIIPVHGTLINRFSHSFGYVTGYNFIRQQTYMAGQDPDVKGIVFDSNSFGGEGAGCFECAGDIQRLAAGKPTLTCIDSNCYSSAYAMAAGTDRIVSTPSGGSGSVGVVSAHISMEKMLEDFGIKITFIHAGAHKVDGNPYQDLPDSVKADVQASVNALMNTFVAHVAKGRKMDEKAVRATEARIYRADEAISLGLIDAIASPQEAMRAFLGELSGSNLKLLKETPMSTEAKPGAENKATPEEMNTARADAVKAERARVSGIQTCEEAKGREALAAHLAFETDMSVDAARKLLAAAPIAAPAAKGNAFKEAMDAGKHPNIGVDGGGSGGDGGEQTGAAAILSAAKMAGVRSYEYDAKH